VAVHSIHPIVVNARSVFICNSHFFGGEMFLFWKLTDRWTTMVIHRVFQFLFLSNGLFLHVHNTYIHVLLL